MADPFMVISMVFTLIVLMMVGGFVLLFPITRRLGALLEQRLQDRRLEKEAGGELAQLRQAIRALEAEVQAVAERQAFTESLLEKREGPSLPAGAGPSRGQREG